MSPLGKRKRGGRSNASKGRRKRGRTTIARVSRSLRLPMMNMKKVCYTGSWSWNTTTTDGFWRYFTYTAFNAVQNFSEIAALFDEYKVNAIKVTFRPRYDTIDGQDNAGGIVQAYAHYVIDPASTTTPTGTYGSTSLNNFLEQANVKTRTLNRPFTVYFRPKAQMELFGGSTASKVIDAGWVKTTQTAVPFGGFHMYIQQNNFTNTSANIILDMFVTMYMQVKNLK